MDPATPATTATPASASLADFLRSRRELLTPMEVGLPPGRRRRTPGLRREEVAALASMSRDYYGRLERGDADRPSAALLGALAQALRLDRDERDHLFRLAGQAAPPRGPDGGEHVGPGMLRILDHLRDAPAEIVTELGESLVQTPLAVALTGDLVALPGPMRSIGYRWFMDPTVRELYDERDHELLGRSFASGLREVLGRRGPGSRAARYAELLLEGSAEFREVWDRREIGVRPADMKRFRHPQVGPIELRCQTLLDPEESHLLLVYTAAPGSGSREKLEVLEVLGDERTEQVVTAPGGPTPR